MKIYRCCAWLAFLVVAAGNLVAAPQTPIMAALGRHPKIEFHGCQAFSPRELQSALDADLRYQAALVSTMPVPDFRDYLIQAIRSGYQQAGYPHATVKAKVVESPGENEFDESTTALVMQIDEGQHYRAGLIGVQGASLIDVERLQNELQRRSEEIAGEVSPPMTKEQVEAALSDPRWVPGGPVCFTPEIIRERADLVRARLLAQGFRWSQFQVKFEPDELTFTATCKIDILQEGPQARLGKITVTGAQRNSVESIIQCAGLDEGAVIDTALLNSARWNLYRSARFLHFKLIVHDDSVDANGVVPLTIDVREFDQAPLLTESFTEEQEVLFKFGRWYETWLDSGKPYRIQLSNVPLDLVARYLPGGQPGMVANVDLTLMPAVGMNLSANLRLANETKAHRSFQVRVDSNGIDCIFPAQQLRIRLANPLATKDSRLHVGLAQWTGGLSGDDPDHKFRFEWKLSYNFSATPRADHFRFPSHIAPVVMVDMKTRPGSECRFEGNELILKTTLGTFRVDRGTGELNSFQGPSREIIPVEITIQKDPEAWRRIQSDLEENTRGFQTLAGKNASFLHVAALLHRQCDFQIAPLFNEAALKGMAWLSSAINEAAETPTPAATTRLADRMARKFEVNAINELTPLQQEYLGKWKPGWGFYLINLNAFVSDESCLSDMIAIGSAWLCREDEWLGAADLLATSEMGPLSHLAGALYLKGFHSKASFQLANKGRALRNSHLYVREIDGLVNDDSLVGDVLLKLMRRLKELPPEEIDRLAKEFDLGQYTPLFASIHNQLADLPDDQFRDASAKAWIALYERFFRERTGQLLAALAPFGPSTDSSSMTINLVGTSNSSQPAESELQTQDKRQIQQTSATVSDESFNQPSEIELQALIAGTKDKAKAAKETPKQVSYLDLFNPTQSLPDQDGEKKCDKAESPKGEDTPATPVTTVSVLNDLFRSMEQERVVATIDGENLLLKDFVLETWMSTLKLQLLKPHYQLNAAVGQRIINSVVSSCQPFFIERCLLVREAKRKLTATQLEEAKAAIEAKWAEELTLLMQRLHVDSPDILRLFLESNGFDLDEYHRVMSEKLLAEGFLNQELAQTYSPSTEELRTYYQSHLSNFSQGGKVRWRQLSIDFDGAISRREARRTAEKVLAELGAGADFAELIRKYGTGPKAKDGGLWDWTDRGIVAPQSINAALFSMPVGQTSDIIETADAIQLVQVIERQEGTVRSFDESQPQVKALLAAETLAARSLAYREALRRSAKIEVLFVPAKPKTAGAEPAK